MYIDKVWLVMGFFIVREIENKGVIDILKMFL